MTSFRRIAVRGLVPSLAIACLASAGVAERQEKLADEWLTTPVDDQTFKRYLEFFTYDRRVPLDLKLIDTSDAEGIRKEHLSFQSTRGMRVFANLYRLTSAATAESPAIVFLHSAAIGGKDSRESKQICTALARAGYTVLAIDQQ